LFNQKNILTTAAVSAIYLLLSAMLVGYKTDQLVLVLLFNALYYSSAITRKFIIAFSIFIAFWIIFDYMKAFPNYRYSAVHIESLYNAEKSVFGIHENGTILTPNEYLLKHHITFLDITTGLFYLCWMPVPLLFAFLLFVKKRKQMLYFALTFLFVNLLGFIVYYSYPAAPPWYVQAHGFEFYRTTPGSTAGLQRFDDYFHTNIFGSLYSKSSNIFAAMPSLHSAYPLVAFYYGVKNKLGWVNIILGTVTAGIWFSAIYTSHHYILDVVAGITIAIIGIFLFQKVLLKTKWFNRFVDHMYEAVK
jgi:hypothetical protein